MLKFQTWQDIRTKTKNKNTMIRKYSQGTGGGPSISDALTDMDMKVLSTMTSQVLQGSDVPETEISFQFPEEVIEIEVTNDNDDEPLDNHYSSLNNISDLPSCSKDIMQTQVEENKSNTATKSSNFTTILADSNNNSEFDGKPFLDHQYSVPENSNVAVQPCHGEKKKIHKEVVGGKKINKAFCNSNIVKTPKKRSVAVQRLLKSSDASTILANVSNKDLDIREKYYERKLNLMERLVVAIEKIASVQCQTVNCQ